jgi:hypothetical protein
MDNIIALWNDRLDNLEHSGDCVQIPLHSSDVKTVLAEFCPDEFVAIRDDLKLRTPTHVLLFATELEALLDYIEARSE